MKRRQLFLRHIHLPFHRRIQTLHKSLSISERALFYLIAGAFIVSGILLLFKVNDSLLHDVPRRGGTVVEGVVGAPRFINPLLAISDADRDLTTLVYSGLMRVNTDGILVPDLAQQYSISDDSLTYTFTLRDDVIFHDTKPVTTADIEYTIRMAQDPQLRSSKRASWDGVKVNIIDEKTIAFVLPQPYAPFLENTTLGILPRHIWKNIPVEEFSFSAYNTNPIGSGPYKPQKPKQNSSGIYDYYVLHPFKEYSAGYGYIKNLILSFFPNETALIEAYEKGSVDMINSISPEKARELAQSGTTVRHTTLPRFFGVFFNQNEAPIFTDKSVRVALDHAINKDALIDAVLFGYGVPLDGPIPPGLLNASDTDTVNEEIRIVDATSTPPIEEAQEMLRNAGWTRDEETGFFEKNTKQTKATLSFSISTSDVPELKAAADIVARTWRLVGADVTVKVFDESDLRQNIIRPRNYDALLFGGVVGRDLDLYAFWHSSQRNDPGLNIAMYTNITADRALERARASHDPLERTAALREFETTVTQDVPTIFLYAPEFIYVTRPDVAGITIDHITSPSERFTNVFDWYIEHDRVWKFFTTYTRTAE